jgi:plasmid maintenance system killer protein
MIRLGATPLLGKCGTASGRASFAVSILKRRLTCCSLNISGTLQDLSPLRTVGLHKLKGDRKNQWAMTVNARWRICFEFSKGDAHEVEIVDYHRG